MQNDGKIKTLTNIKMIFPDKSFTKISNGIWKHYHKGDTDTIKTELTSINGCFASTNGPS